MSTFTQHIGIDYSGAETPSASLKGLRGYLAKDDSVPLEIPPPSSPRKYWTRRGIAEIGWAAFSRSTAYKTLTRFSRRPKQGCWVKVQPLLKGPTYNKTLLKENPMAEPQPNKPPPPEEEETLEEALAEEQWAWERRQYQQSRGKFGGSKG